jgi:hypothetical protein
MYMLPMIEHSNAPTNATGVLPVLADTLTNAQQQDHVVVLHL